MNIAIISYSKDKASINIKENLVNNFDFDESDEKFDNNNIFQTTIDNNIIKLYTINSEHIYTDGLDRKIDADLFIFISKHSAVEGRPSLTCHPIGNFGKAEKGGREKTLCTAPSFFLKNILNELNKNSDDADYDVTMEATHHGPFLEKPILFVEIGSSEKEWEDQNAGSIIAKSLISTIKNNSNNNDSINKNFNEKNNNYESIFVIGGSHYNHVATKAMLKTNFGVGHICTKYNLENLDESLIKQAMKKTIPEARFVLLDWKGLGKEKKGIVDILERSNIEYRRSDKFFD
ncbi:MAG: D-aminoacyl-tRNA deacylase [Candidatus Woesearchaeota archaeon]|nr:D-aminoacyl-tRNA deacylase [Candidatus Woesearchaeota archaeon]